METGKTWQDLGNMKHRSKARERQTEASAYWRERDQTTVNELIGLLSQEDQ